jgi:hypothetical protein
MPDPLDIYALMSGSEPDAAASARVMANMIRANRMGQLGSALGSPDAISVMGNVVGSHAKQDEDLLVKGLTAREGMNTRKEISDNTNALKATIAAMQEGGKDRRFKPYKFSGNALTGRTRGNEATGEADYTPPTAKPVDPNAGAKPKTLAYSEVKDVQNLNKELEAINGMETGFKDEYAGGGPLGAASVRLKKALGSYASPKSQEEAAYWADYQRMIDIPQRHEKFGSALTPGESRIWESARNLGPNSDPKVVRQAITSMKGILNRHLSSWKESRSAAGYGTEQLDPLTKAVGATVVAPAADKSPVEGAIKTKSGKWAVKNADGKYEYVE